MEEETDGESQDTIRWETQGINTNAARFHAMLALVVPAGIPGETTFPGEGAGECGMTEGRSVDGHRNVFGQGPDVLPQEQAHATSDDMPCRREIRGKRLGTTLTP